MKFKVKIDEQTFDIEVGDLTQRPIVVLVDGKSFSVWPEENQVESIPQKPALPPIQPGPKPSASSMIPPIPAKPASNILAPIPGIITAISVRPGDEIRIGDELCKLEAMKMNNSIRSHRAGKINAIHVNVGQQVKHNELLIEFAEG